MVENGLIVYVGKPDGFGRKIWDDYEAKRYHRPKDEYDPGFDLSGAAAAARIAMDIGWRVAQAPRMPQWNPGDEFAAARTRAAAAASAGAP